MIHIIKSIITIESISKKNKPSHIWMIYLITKSRNVMLYFKRNHFKIPYSITTAWLCDLREWRHNGESLAFINSFR